MFDMACMYARAFSGLILTGFIAEVIAEGETPCGVVVDGFRNDAG